MWNDLNFAFGNTLTASEMNSLHGNFEAFFSGDSGAPPAKLGAFTVSLAHQSGILYVPPSGVAVIPKMLAYMTNGSGYAYTGNKLYLEINAGGAWRTNGCGNVFGLIFGNSADTRFRNTDTSTMTLYYLKIL